jgi:hypothetical protein
MILFTSRRQRHVTFFHVTGNEDCFASKLSLLGCWIWRHRTWLRPSYKKGCHNNPHGTTRTKWTWGCTGQQRWVLSYFRDISKLKKKKEFNIYHNYYSPSSWTVKHSRRNFFFLPTLHFIHAFIFLPPFSRIIFSFILRCCHHSSTPSWLQLLDVKTRQFRKRN